jgi:hypothetical protein
MEKAKTASGNVEQNTGKCKEKQPNYYVWQSLTFLLYYLYVPLPWNLLKFIFIILKYSTENVQILPRRKILTHR